MGFKREISKCLNDLGVLTSYKATLIGGVGGYFECVRSLGEVTKNRICINLKKGAVILEGNSLTISKYCDGDLVVTGDIFKVEVVL